MRRARQRQAAAPSPEAGAGDPGEALISVRGAGRHYGPASADWAVRGFEVDIRSGDFVAITGPSGAGKSTLLNCLALLDVFDTGSYTLAGKRVDRMRPAEVQRIRGEQFGFVFQSSNIIPDRDVTKNVEIPLSSLGVPVHHRPGLIAEALIRANILHRAGQNASLLSGGERQRVAIARSLVNRPQVLFLDEPSGNLDSANTQAMLDLLQELNRAGTTIVYATHDLDLAAAADRQLKVLDGIVTEEPRPRDAHTPLPPPFESGIPPDTAAGVRRAVRQVSDAVSEAAFSLYARPARTLLALLSIALGVAGLVTGVNLGTTADSQVDKLIANASLNHVYVAQTDPSAASAVADFSETNIKALHRLPTVEAVGNFDQIGADSAQVSRFALPQDSGGQTPALGVSSGTFPALGIHLAPSTAKLFDLAPIDSNIAVVGSAAAKSLGLQAGTHQTLWLDGTRFDVLGIIPGSTQYPLVTDSVLISHTAAAQLHLLTQSEFVVETIPGRADTTATAIPYALDPGDPGRFSTNGYANLQSLRTQVSDSIGGLLLALAAVFLCIAILSTSSTMTNSVLQRTSEIGLRMATGSSPAKIAGLFLTEGAALGLIGGLLGSTAGVIAVLTTAITQHWTPALNPASITLGIACGFASGLIAAAIPSIRASRTQPALAVRT